MTHRDCDTSQVTDADDSTTCYPLTGRHLQVAAILGHVPHGGRMRLTVTELGQIGELVAWGESQASDPDRHSDSGRVSVRRTDEPPRAGQLTWAERETNNVTDERRSA